MKKNWFYNFCTALAVAGMAYILIAGVSSVGGNQEYPYAMKGLLIFVFLLAWVGVHFIALLSARLGIAHKLDGKKRLVMGLEAFFVILVLAVAFILRYDVIVKLPMQPVSDYKTYYEIAQMLKEGTLQEAGEGYCNYIAMFPHIIGYCYILKNIFILFGASVWNGQIANVCFSVGTVFLIYRIARRLGGRLAGVTALLAAAFWPSQILYVNMLAAEYSFSFFLYLAVLLFLHLAMDYDGTTKHAVRAILLHILLGGLIAVTAAIRPMALILLIAIILCLLPQKITLPGIPRNSISIWVRFLEKGWLRGVLILLSYLILSGIITTDIELTINKTVPSFSESFGYNLLVGLNTDSNGGWNEADSKFLYDNLDKTGSPVEAQLACRNQAFKRLSSNPEAIFNLFINKYELLWGNDDYGVTWNLAFLKEQNQLTPERADFLYRAEKANHMVYMVFILFSLLTLLSMFQKKASYLHVLVLLYLGTVAMHLMVESQNRYHFHVLPAIMIVAAVGISYIFENAMVFVRSSDRERGEKESAQNRENAVLKQFEEEEHQAIENRYKIMTNAFDMQSAIENGNVVVTVSEGYMIPDSGVVYDRNAESEKNSEVKEKTDMTGEINENIKPNDLLAKTDQEEEILVEEESLPERHLPDLETLLNKIEELERKQEELLKGYAFLKEELAQVKINLSEPDKSEEKKDDVWPETGSYSKNVLKDQKTLNKKTKKKESEKFFGKFGKRNYIKAKRNGWRDGK